MKTWKHSVSSADTAPSTAPLLLLGTVENNLRTARQMGYDAIEIHTREDEDLDIDSIRRFDPETQRSVEKAAVT